MFFKQNIFFFLLLVLAGTVSGQGETSIRASVDKNRILLGEPFTLTVEARFANGTPVFLAGIDSIPHFEMATDPQTDSSNTNGLVTIRRIYPLTSFDSGHWVIPAFSLSKKISSDTIGIDVVFSEFDPAQEYHDIKDIIGVNVAKGKPWWWFAAGGALILALLLIYFLRRRKPVVIEKQETAIDPYKEAVSQLERLQRSKPDSKLYNTQLSGIFRLYVFRRKGVFSLQKTTDDLLLQLKDTGMSKEQFEKLSQSLRMGDWVKFAKYSTSEADDRMAHEVILDAIHEIEKQADTNLPGGKDR